MSVPGTFCLGSFLQTLGWQAMGHGLFLYLQGRRSSLQGGTEGTHIQSRGKASQWDFISSIKSYKQFICLNVLKRVFGFLRQLERQSEDKSEKHIWLSSKRKYSIRLWQRRWQRRPIKKMWCTQVSLVVFQAQVTVVMILFVLIYLSDSKLETQCSCIF